MSSNLYHFNATCEMEVGNGTFSFTPPAYLQQFESELELLPLYLATSSDYLWVTKKPTQSFLERLNALKTDLPVIAGKELLIQKIKNGAKLDFLKPWGWSPMEHKKLEAFKKYCNKDFNEQPNSNWIKSHRELYGRQTALKVLETFVEIANSKDLFVEHDYLARVVYDYQKIEELHKNFGKLIIKAPWSASGRGIVILNQPSIHKTYGQWINGIIKNQGFIMCEPLFDKLFDLSFHFEIEANKKVTFLGQASFATDERGQYIGNYIQALPPDLSQEENDFLCESHMNFIAEYLAASLKQSEIYKQYTGVLGVDVLVYRDKIGKLKFNPCMEINLRQNMGTVALKIRELLHPNAKGMWQVKRFNKPNTNDAIEFDLMMQQHDPLQIEDDKIRKGYLPLIEPYTNRIYALYMLAE